MTINERIKHLRKSLSLNQTDFGGKIGIKVSQASYIEKVGNPVSPRVIQLICTTFNISEKWLVEGKGDMYVSTEDAIIEKVSQMYDLTPQQEAFARKWLQLPTDVRESVLDYVVELAESIKAAKENPGTKKAEATASADQGTDCTPVENANLLPTSCQPFASPFPPPEYDQEGRPPGIPDDEWEILQMFRYEKRKASGASHLTCSEMA